MVLEKSVPPRPQTRSYSMSEKSQETFISIKKSFRKLLGSQRMGCLDGAEEPDWSLLVASVLAMLDAPSFNLLELYFSYS